MAIKNVIWFDELSMKDLAQVGGKNASLGEMINELMSEILDSNYDFDIPLEVTSFPGHHEEQSLRMRLTDMFAGN